MKSPHLALALLAFTALAACGSSEPVAVVEPVDLGAGNESFAPRLFNVDGVTSISWLQAQDGAHALKYATWEGDRWSEVREVTAGKNWFANWADLPGVRRVAGGGWVAWWLEKSAPDTYAYDVQLAFSDDGGKWVRYGTPHSDGTATEHGFVTAFDLPDDGLGLAWLDGRNTATAGGGHGAHAEGGMTLRYGLFDASGQLTEEAEFDGLTCDCCQTDSTATKDGIVMVYRNRTEGEIRDIHATRYSSGHWSEPVQVHADGWKIDGCPVNGPAVAAKADMVGVAWFTAPSGKGEVRFAWSRDGGRSFEQPVRLDSGRPQGRVDVVMHPESGALVSWVEQGPEGAEVRVRQVRADGTMAPAVSLLQTHAGRAAGFPRMTMQPDGTLLLAWTEVKGDARQVRTARVTL